MGQVLPLAGIRMVADTIREPRLGIAAARDSAGGVVVRVLPGGAAEEAGVAPGDVLLALGDIAITDPNFGPKFRERFGKDGRAAAADQVRRDGQTADAQREGEGRARGAKPAGARSVGVGESGAGAGRDLQGAALA